MKDSNAIGVIRRIDDLGRVVIPVEMRRSFGLGAGDPVEIFGTTNGMNIYPAHRFGDLISYTRNLIEAIKCNDSIRQEDAERLISMTSKILDEIKRL